MYIRKLAWRGIEVVPTVERGLRVAQVGRAARMVLHEGTSVVLPRPVLVGGGSEAAAEFGRRLMNNGRYWASSVDAMFLPQTTFLTKQGHLLIGGNHICDELDYSLDPTLRNHALTPAPRGYELSPWFVNEIPRAEVIPGATWLIHPRWGHNYTHWHTEALCQTDCAPLLRGKVPRLAMPAGNAFQRASMELLPPLGFERIAVPEPVARFEIAVVLTHGLFRTFLHPCVASFFGSWRRDRLAGLGLPETPAQRRPVYLARLDSRFRPLENERELCAALEARGFRIVVASEHSYAEQIRIFSEASVLVSPHGSGLTNMIFTPPGTPVVEIRPTNAGERSPFIDRSYWCVAGLAGRPYGALFYDSAPQESAWRCNIPHVLAALSRLAEALRGASAKGRPA